MANRLMDLTGAVFGRLTVITDAGRDPKGRRFWRCVCSCGNERVTTATKLREGRAVSCGCLKRGRLKHGLTESAEYSTWSNIKSRCLNPRAADYPDYGGREITICDRWRDSFEAFYADMGERPEGMSIDRINNDGNYEPGNCRWATANEQRNNQRMRQSHAATHYSDKPCIRGHFERYTNGGNCVECTRLRHAARRDRAPSPSIIDYTELFNPQCLHTL